MKPFAKMKSALPEPSGFAAARLLDFSLIQSGAFKADAFGVGGLFFFGLPPFAPLARAAAALASDETLPPRRPSACAALFTDSNLDDAVAGGVKLRHARCRLGLGVEELGVFDLRRVVRVGQLVAGDHPSAGVVFDCVFGAGVGVRCHACSKTHALGLCNNYFRKSFGLGFPWAAGVARKTSAPNPREKSNGQAEPHAGLGGQS